jgi:hypothetical protein
MSNLTTEELFLRRGWVCFQEKSNFTQENLKSTARFAEYTQEVIEVEMNAQVGEAAGKVWQLLNDSGPQTLAQIKKKVNGSGDLVGFALGWLAREEKVDISKDKNSFKVALR